MTRRYIAVGVLLIIATAAGNSFAQHQRKFECPDVLFVGPRSIPAGWQLAFGDKRIAFEEAAVLGDTLNCIYGTDSLVNTFTLQRTAPPGFKCRVVESSSNARHNKTFACTSSKPSIHIPGKVN